MFNIYTIWDNFMGWSTAFIVYFTTNRSKITPFNYQWKALGKATHYDRRPTCYSIMLMSVLSCRPGWRIDKLSPCYGGGTTSYYREMAVLMKEAGYTVCHKKSWWRHDTLLALLALCVGNPSQRASNMEPISFRVIYWHCGHLTMVPVPVN